MSADPAAPEAGGSLDAARRLVDDLPAAPAVWCSGLRKRYGRQAAVDDGVVTAVAGSLSVDEVLSVARGLRGDR